MKTVPIYLIASLTIACAGSSSELRSKVDGARADVNQSLERVEEKARPAVRPVAEKIDRGANRAATKLGLRNAEDEPAKEE